MSYSTKQEPFKLSMLGGTIERRFNQQRDKYDLPWGDLADVDIPDDLRQEAREVWTRLAYNEYRSAAAMNAVTETLVAARAPLDLTAVASGFTADELKHAELCARVVVELGGPSPFLTQASELIWPKPTTRLHPLVRAADLVVRVFCVAESVALPMSHAVTKVCADVPLIGAVHRRIAKDEAAHAAFGWIFLDWADPWLTDRQRKHLAGAAQQAIDDYRTLLDAYGTEPAETLGWLSGHDFHATGVQALAESVCAPLRERGIDVN